MVDIPLPVGSQTAPDLSYCSSQLTACRPARLIVYKLLSQSQSYVMTDGQSASMSWCQAPIWSPRPDFYYCQTVSGVLVWGAFSDEGGSVVYNRCCIRVCWGDHVIATEPLPCNGRCFQSHSPATAVSTGFTIRRHGTIHIYIYTYVSKVACTWTLTKTRTAC
jgi:hypothetical protein